jgi:hypothetical protein
MGEHLSQTGRGVAYRFIAIQKKMVSVAGSLRRRCSRTPHPSITASTAAGDTTEARASNDNSGRAAASAVHSRIINMGWLLVREGGDASSPYQSQLLR